MDNTKYELDKCTECINYSYMWGCTAYGDPVAFEDCLKKDIYKNEYLERKSEV